MNEVIKQMQKRIVEGIQLPDKKQQNQLRKDVEQALQEWTIVNKVDTKKENKKEKVKF